MGTRSGIAVEIEDGKSIRSYCHWDGYPSNNGKLLLEFYNTKEKAEELVRIGNMSSLAPSCEKPEGHTFDTPVKGYCTFYGRDRGEEGTNCIEAETDDTSADGWEEFLYQFKDGKWFVNRVHKKSEGWIELTLEFCKED
jgi:hypothetical protein